MNVPKIGSAVPRRGNALSRWIGRTILRLGGWRFEGEVPDVPRFICIGAPHSSNWDFLVVMGGILALGIRMSIMGKHTLLKGPLGPFMRWCGVIPVDRRAAHGIVGECIQAFRTMPQLTMAIAAEGSRTPGAHWKSGFWHIGLQAQVPVLPCALDYGTRRIRFGESFVPTPDLAADLERLNRFYLGTRGARRTIDRPITVKELPRAAE
ncbi:lysophospholipid acyltransferase family protein [Oleisolibacter albus]|uniref:lysophospholipid acyltransferase family protein n=1 Tax=Oleisolibacter albus TaxID=2171757 RepID=UPI000DF46F58|nr:lysophospholipid acyltransferase family protein [Oleisolibacter albus]